MSLGHGEFYLNINQIFHPGGPWNYSENKLANSLLSCSRSCSRLIKKIGIKEPPEANLCCSACSYSFYCLTITSCLSLMEKTDTPLCPLAILTTGFVPDILQTWLQNYLLNPKTWHTKKPKPIIMIENDEDNNSPSVDESYKQYPSSKYATSSNVKNFPIHKIKED